MDKVNTYRVEIKRVLSTYADLVIQQSTPGLETLLAFDEACDQYLWIQAGWRDDRRIYGVTVHARIIDGKIHVEQDWTEDGIASDLLRAGVPREDIIFGFHEPATTDVPEAVSR